MVTTILADVEKLNILSKMHYYEERLVRVFGKHIHRKLAIFISFLVMYLTDISHKYIAIAR